MSLVRSIAMAAPVALALLAAPGRASAEASATDRAAADALFQASGKLAAESRWAEACAKLEASLKLDPAIGTLVRLGSCYEHLGKTASAWRTSSRTSVSKPDAAASAGWPGGSASAT